MNSFEWNKVIGALLATGLFVVVVGIAADDLFEIEQPELKGYKVEGVEEAATEEVVVTPEEGPSLANLLAGASAEKGARVFGRCSACHSVQDGGPHGIGPNLYGIVGAAVGGREGFSYSDALADNGGSWNYELLDAYIEDPATAIPDNRMPFSGIDRAGQRADLIAYLRLLSTDPVPLPEAVSEVEAETPTLVEPEPEAPAEAPPEEPAVDPVEELTGEPATEPPLEEAPAEMPAAGSPIAAALESASLERGAAAFAACAICHNAEKDGAHKIGPNLFAVAGADIARHTDFSYSAALSAEDGVWSDEKLDAFLTSPSVAIPGNKMPFGGIGSIEGRADLILYLKSLNEPSPE